MDEAREKTARYFLVSFGASVVGPTLECDSTAEAVKGFSDVETNIEEGGGGGGAPTAAIGGGAAVAILLMVGLGCYYLGKKRKAGSQSSVAQTAISLTTTKEKVQESGAPAKTRPTSEYL